MPVITWTSNSFLYTGSPTRFTIQIGEMRGLPEFWVIEAVQLMNVFEISEIVFKKKNICHYKIAYRKKIPEPNFVHAH